MTPNPFAQERLLFAPATPDADAIPTIFAFPNEYTVGITSLGYQIVWATLAVRSDIEVAVYLLISANNFPDIQNYWDFRFLGN